MTRAQEHGVTLAAGIDVGGTKCLGVVIDSDADITTEHDIKLQVRHPTPHASKLVDALVGLVGELGDFESLGVGVPGSSPTTHHARVAQHPRLRRHRGRP